MCVEIIWGNVLKCKLPHPESLTLILLPSMVEPDSSPLECMLFLVTHFWLIECGRRETVSTCKIRSFVSLLNHSLWGNQRSCQEVPLEVHVVRNQGLLPRAKCECHRGSGCYSPSQPFIWQQAQPTPLPQSRERTWARTSQEFPTHRNHEIISKCLLF